MQKIRHSNSHWLRYALTLLYACATLQFIRFYSKSTVLYLNMPAYLTGHERIPFQERILPVLLLRPMYHSTWFMHHFAHSNGAFTLEKGPFYIVSLIAFAAAAAYTQRLYRALTVSGALAFMIYPILLFITMWTYVIHSEANFSYPYDLPSLAFFTAGLYYIYTRRFWPLFAVILIGSFNRETTLFLIGIYVIDCATITTETLGLTPTARLGRFKLGLIPWQRVALLSIVWLAIKLVLLYSFRHNDASESFLRIHYNVNQLRIRLLPALLNICGYTLPLVLIFAGSLRPRRFANYLFILIPWFAVMFCSGVIVETRIYGELCSFSAIALVLIMERHARTGNIEQLPAEPQQVDTDHKARVLPYTAAD